LSVAHRIIVLTLRIAARDDDIALAFCREIRSQLEIRVVGIIEHKEPGFGGVSQLSFDAVDILINLNNARELRKGLPNTLIGTYVDSKYALVSALCIALESVTS
jgi:hypothetical protein